MRKVYEKPEIEVSLYLVNEAFASCTKIVNLGPSTATSSSTCTSYTEYEDTGSGPTEDDGLEWVLATASTGEDFYVDQENATCGCYYTSGVGTILRS